MSLTALLNQTAIPQRHTVTADSIGGKVITWADITTAVAVRRQDAKAETKRRYASDNIIVTHTVFSEYGGIQTGDRFKDGTVYWLVRGIRERSEIGGMGTFYVYDCEQVKTQVS